MYGYRPTTRLLSMLEMLQARGRMSAPELARRLEVGERTVRRYAAMLQEMGVPVEGERGRYGGYVLRPGYRMPPMMFTEEEVLGLVLGLLAARRLGLSGAAPAAEGALAKLERVMPEALRGRIRGLQQTLSFAIERPAASARSEALLTLAAAVGRRRRVWMRYRSGSSNETERRFDPYGIFYREGYWYAAGYCHLRRGLRMFRVDRVLHAALLEARFEVPPGLDSPEALLREVAAAPSGEWSVEVLLETEMEDARRQLPAVGVSLEETERGTLLRCSTSDLGWMARVLAGLGCSFVVRAPEELRKALEERAAELYALARRR